MILNRQQKAPSFRPGIRNAASEARLEAFDGWTFSMEPSPGFFDWNTQCVQQIQGRDTTGSAARRALKPGAATGRHRDYGIAATAAISFL
jgi:hypothetical protein